MSSFIILFMTSFCHYFTWNKDMFSYPLSTNTGMCSSMRSRRNSSCTVRGRACALFFSLTMLLLRDFRPSRAGRISTLMNLKFPTFPAHRPRHSPLAFIVMMSMTSSFLKRRASRSYGLGV